MMKNDLILQEIELMLDFLGGLKLRHNIHILYVDDVLFEPCFKIPDEYRTLLHKYFGMEDAALFENYMLVAIRDDKAEILSVEAEATPFHDDFNSVVYYRFDYGTRGGENKILRGRNWCELNIPALWRTGRTLVDDWMSWCRYHVFDDDDFATSKKYNDVRHEILALRSRFAKQIL